MEFEFAKKVLLVGDDETLDQMKPAIENQSERIEVIAATSVSKALRILEKEDFDVIVSDYKILEMNGIEFLKEVRGEKKMEIPFILFMEKMNQEIILKALKGGADRVVYRGDDIMMSSKVLHQALKQENLNHIRKKELERHRMNVNNNFSILNI